MYKAIIFDIGQTLVEYNKPLNWSESYRPALERAAYELRNDKVKIIDLAVKYGYNNADSFTRAFAKQHGVLPTEVNEHTPLKIYPPVSFYVAIKGASELNFKIVNTDRIQLKGISKQFTDSAAERFEQEHIMWSNISTMMFKIRFVLPLKAYGMEFGIAEFIQ